MNAHDCKHIQSLFSGYIDAELNAQQRQEVKEHIESCTACKKEFEAFNLMAKMLHSMEKIDAPADFTEKVNQRIDDKKSVDSFLKNLVRDQRFKVPLTISAAILLFVCVRSFYPEILSYKSDQGQIRGVKSDKAEIPVELAKAKLPLPVSDIRIKSESDVFLDKNVPKSRILTEQRYSEDEKVIADTERKLASVESASKMQKALRVNGYNASIGDSEAKDLLLDAVEEKINAVTDRLYILKIKSLNIDKTRAEIIGYINTAGIEQDISLADAVERAEEKAYSLIISITSKQLTDLIAVLNQQQAEISSIPDVTGSSGEPFLIRIEIDEKK
ncbi:MAG: zf-HC2 domain-containing protein [Candidatus Omnitrophica bacterium]|nr:zf-HC2 domain-containing protein [Candidatus Omnitrophota bacterium]